MSLRQPAWTMVKFKGNQEATLFKILASSPGTVFCKENANSDKTSICLLKSPRSPVGFDELAEQLLLTGLFSDQQWYKNSVLIDPKTSRVTCPVNLSFQFIHFKSKYITVLLFRLLKLSINLL